MSRDYCIRRMAPHDAKEIIAVFEKLLPNDWRHGDLPGVDAVQNMLADRRFVLLMAFSGPAAAGFASGWLLPSVTHAGSIAMFDDLFVAPSDRRRGVGLQLVEAFRTLAISESEKPLVMWSGTGVDNAACQRVFAKSGAAPKGETYQEFVWPDVEKT